MAKIKSVYGIRGGYIVEFADGYITAICAYEMAEEAAERWCDEHHILLNSSYLVCGWDEADELLDKWGYDENLYYF